MKRIDSFDINKIIDEVYEETLTRQDVILLMDCREYEMDPEDVSDLVESLRDSGQVKEVDGYELVAKGSLITLQRTDF